MRDREVERDEEKVIEIEREEWNDGISEKETKKGKKKERL